MLARTTLRIDQDTYDCIKTLSLHARRNVQDVVNEALIFYLPVLKKKSQEKKGRKIKFKSYPLHFKGGSRKEIYEDI